MRGFGVSLVHAARARGGVPGRVAVIHGGRALSDVVSETPRPAGARRLLLVDCDQFFVQCARLADPEGAGRAELLLVGGGADQRGVVTSASYPTRRFGVRSGMPTAQALRLCPDALVVPVPRALCEAKSREVREVLRRFTPVVEAASIDEAYLDLTGTEALYRGEPLEATARRIQDAVREETGIAVSIGGGATRVVAKLAAGLAKPAGVRIVPPGGEAEFMRAFDLSDIPGVGPVFTSELRALGLRTVVDALRLDEATLAEQLGPRRGPWLYRRIRGMDSDVVDADAPVKSVSREETFVRDIERDDELETELLALATRLAADLRRRGLRARTLTVKLRDADFRTRQASRTVPEPLDTDRAVYALARELLAKLRAARRTGARLLGIAASGFGEAPAGRQLDLFGAGGGAAGGGGDSGAGDQDRDRTLARAVDDLRAKFGPDAVKPGKLLDRG